MRNRTTNRLAIAAAATVASSVMILTNIGGSGAAYAISNPGCLQDTCPTATPTTTPTPTPTASASSSAVPTDSPKPTASGPEGSSGPTVTPDPTDTAVAPVTGAATVSGKFTLGNGAPLPNYPVTLTAMDDIPAVGASAAPTVVGTATTGADGTWTFTLPDPLPSNLQTLADDNGGVLDLEADVYGQAPNGNLMSASDFMSAGVAEGGSTTAGSAAVRANSTPDSVPILPSAGTTEVLPPSDTVAAQSAASAIDSSDDGASQDAAAPTWQSDDGASLAGYNPEVVNGVDYTSVVPDRSLPCNTVTSTLKTGIYYTTVGEAHAFYDATASFDYSSSLSSTWGIMYSTSGEGFKESGKVTHTNKMGYSTGFTGQGPYWAKQWRIPIEYAETEAVYRCGGIVDSRTYKIAPVKFEVPGGGAVAEYGANVSSKDGADGYWHAPVSHRAVIPPKAYFQLTKGNSLTIGYSATAFGVSISLDTTYDSSHYEKITAGSAKLEHDIWGANGPVSNNPGVLYSY